MPQSTGTRLMGYVDLSALIEMRRFCRKKDGCLDGTSETDVIDIDSKPSGCELT